MNENGAAARGRATARELFAAVKSADAPRVRQLLSAEPLARHARECGNEEIARLLRGSRDGPRAEEDESA